jgi:4-diphosphocytidyl-2-C-methyl-D-erythritol kinase
MPDLRVTAPAKINLHLEVLGLRPDGFHELAMVMQTLDLADTLVMAPTADGAISLRTDAEGLPTGTDNLIVRAAEQLRQRVGLPELGAAIRLEKRIPIGAGLAGGSSDAAAALVGLNELWGCGLETADLHAIAASLGSDVPYCLEGGSRLCFGRGEILEPLPGAGTGEAPGLGVLLIKHPQASVSTPWAYGRCRELRSDFYLESEADFAQRRDALRTGPLTEALRGQGPLPRLRNDLQAVVEPEVASVREGLALLLGAEGVLAAAMSGSGPSLFALFQGFAAAEAAHRQLEAELTAAGFQAWCCRCTGSGASLLPDAPQP